MTCSIRRQCEPSIRRSGVTWTASPPDRKFARRCRYKACRRRRKHGVGTALRRAGGDRHGARAQAGAGAKLWPSVIGIAAALGSVFLLTHAVKTLPMATAYAVWTGHLRGDHCVASAGGIERLGIRAHRAGVWPLRKRLLSRQGGRCPLAGTSSAKRPPQNPEDLTIFHATGRVVSVRRHAGRVQWCASSTLLPTA